MLKLATILDNPGEPFAPTRYRDPAKLVEMGYNAVALYETTALSGMTSDADAPAGELRQWVAHQYDHARQRIVAAREAGLKTFIAYDALVLPRSLVQAQPKRFTCIKRSDTLCPASDALLDRCVQGLAALLDQLDPDGTNTVDGVVLRFGDNDVSRLAHLCGNDVYAPRCENCAAMTPAQRIAAVLKRLYELVVEQRGLTLIARAWNVKPGGMHDQPDLAKSLAPLLPGKEDDDRLILSFKFSQTDFWRYQPWNASSLVFGRRPIVYELQCQREFEGKGAVPNWQAPLWRDGCPEVTDQPCAGLAQAVTRVNFAGIWAWVRGGGWGGPFVKNETWIDANAFAAPRLADQPDVDPNLLAREWVVDHLGIEDEQTIEALLEVLTQSTRCVLEAFYLEPYARGRLSGSKTAWHPNGGWIQDDQLDAQAAWRIIDRLNDEQLARVVREKQQAVDRTARCRSKLSKCINQGTRSVLEPLVSSLIYAESFYQALADLIAGLAAYRQYKSSQPVGALASDASRGAVGAHGVQVAQSNAKELTASALLCRRKLFAAQENWNHHTQRHCTLPGAPTAFREVNFWELTQRILGEVSGEG